MPQQPEMLALIEPAESQTASRRMAAMHDEQERWEHWRKGFGLLTREQIQCANHPNWAWGDYEI